MATVQSVASASDDVAAIGHAFAWPLLVLVALIVFRAPLTAALGRLSEVDVGKTKVLLQGQAEQAANTTKAVLSAAAGAPASPPEIAAAAAKSSSSPADAVLDAWKVVEDAAGKASGQNTGVTSPSVPEVVNTLTSKGLRSALVPVAQSLESLRAVAAKDARSITPATAKSFVAAADDLVRLVDQAGAATGASG